MMDHSIFSRATMRKRGADAFNAGRTRCSHNMNHDAAALPDWLEGFDHAAQAWYRQQRPQAQVVLAEVSPP